MDLHSPSKICFTRDIFVCQNCETYKERERIMRGIYANSKETERRTGKD